MNDRKRPLLPEGMKQDGLGPISMINHPSAGLNYIIGFVEIAQVFDVVPKAYQGIILLAAVP